MNSEKSEDNRRTRVNTRGKQDNVDIRGKRGGKKRSPRGERIDRKITIKIKTRLKWMIQKITDKTRTTQHNRQERTGADRRSWGSRV